MNFLKQGGLSADYKINRALPLLFEVLGISVLAIIVVLAFPPLLLGEKLPAEKGVRGFLLYFVCIGAGYILIQVALIQKFVLFLGHPTYALTVIVFSMLISSGLGSYCSRKLTGDPNDTGRLSAVLVGVAVTVSALAYLAAPVSEFGVGWPLPMKCLVTVCMIAPAGFLMGIPFPTGLTRLERSFPQAVRWAWALNAAASVLGSAAAICLAIYIGLRATVLMGALLYLAALTVVLLRKSAVTLLHAGRSCGSFMKFAEILSFVLVATAASAAPSLDPPKLRLDGSAHPSRYAVDLTIVPDRDTFRGSVDISVDVRTPAEVIWLNSIGLQIQDAAFRSESGVARIRPGLFPAETSSSAYAFDRPISGQGVLHAAYQGKISRNSSAGVFQLKEDREWYVYSQFEPTDARRAFPCFDEPSFKVPWQVTLHVPKDDLALSNTPVQSESSEPDGMKTVRFKPTPPLPSYLVAFAVGRFDVVDAGRVGPRPCA